MLQAKLAASRSTCNSRPQGAVIVVEKRVVATGYNGALPGQEHCSDHDPDIRECPNCWGIVDESSICPTCHNVGAVIIPYCHRRVQGGTDSQKDRLCVSSHAEANAIAQAARLGIAAKGATLYCTTRPCVVCTKLLIQAGIIKVYYELDYDSPEEQWLQALDMERLEISLEALAVALKTLQPNTSRRRLEKTK